MQFKTEKFGMVDVNEESIFTFVRPMIGFNEYKRFILVEHKPNSPFRWFQSIEVPDLAFLVTAPEYFNIDYSFELEDDVAKDLELENIEDLYVFNVSNVPLGFPQLASVNLLSPILINLSKRLVAQVILPNSNLPTSYPLCKDVSKNKAEV